MTIYPHTIEISILCNLMYRDEYRQMVLPHLKEEYWTDDRPQKTIFKLISDYVRKYNKAPTKDILLVELRDHCPMPFP